jgi:hypothetical protein
MQEQLIALLKLCIDQKITIWFARVDRPIGSEIYSLWEHNVNIRSDPYSTSGYCAFGEDITQYTYEEGLRLMELRAFL